MRIVALDHGAARVGAAVCDPTETLTTPLGVLGPDPGEVVTLVAEHEPEMVVVGLPVTLAGAEGEQARAARQYAGELAKRLQVPVETYDERLTTRLADSSVRAGAKAPADAIAAAHLLESFLHRRAGQAPEGTAGP